MQNLTELYNCGICLDALKTPCIISSSDEEHKNCSFSARFCTPCISNTYRCKEIKKCIKCNYEFRSKVNISKDLHTMNVLNSLREGGIIEKFVCSCGMEFLDQFQLDSHFSSDCLEMYVKCKSCPFEGLRKDVLEHNKTCVPMGQINPDTRNRITTIPNDNNWFPVTYGRNIQQSLRMSRIDSNKIINYYKNDIAFEYLDYDDRYF